MADLISKRCRSLLADELASWTLKEIRDEFEEAGIEETAIPDSMLGQRRTLVAGYYASLDFSKAADVQKFIRAATLILREKDRQVQQFRNPWDSPGPIPDHPMIRFIEEMKRSGYEWRNPEFLSVSPSARLADTLAMADKMDLAHLGEHVRRIELALETDPRQAIGSAKELVETAMKTVLDRRQVPYTRSEDMLSLGRKTFTVLKQIPSDIPNAAKGSDTIKKMLSNLASVVQGLAELRGHYGTGHGMQGNAKGLSPRHAKLAVGAASTLACYLLETDRDTPL